MSCRLRMVAFPVSSVAVGPGGGVHRLAGLANFEHLVDLWQTRKAKTAGAICCHALLNPPLEFFFIFFIL